MIKYLFQVFVLSTQILFLQGINAQNQVNISDDITQRFLRYCENVPREEIFIHSDRDNYIAGEDFWFNIYLIDRQSGNPLISTRIIYFEVLNQENRPVIQRRIKIENGFGPGHIVIPDTLSSGNYTIRAYTNWMKNFLPANCFMKDISIYNAFSEKDFISKQQSLDTNVVKISNQYLDNEGVTVSVNNRKPDSLEILVHSGDSYLRNNSSVILFIQTHGQINYISTEQVSERNTKISIHKKVLIPGINHITIFNSHGLPLRERFIYTPFQEEQSLNLTYSGTVNARNKISLELSVNNKPVNKLFSSNLSISVVPASDTIDLTGISDYLIFGSEFGIKPWTTLNGRSISMVPVEIIDSLLLSLKSNWINWDNILSDNLPVLKYRPETMFHYLSGKLINQNSLTIDSGKYIIMSTPGKEAMFQYARTDNEADFNFTVQIDDHYKDLIIQPANPGTDNSIRINSPFSENYFISAAFSEQLSAKTQSLVSKLSINYQVSKIYEASSAVDTAASMFPEFKTKRFYGKPDIELLMADYIKLPVMEEVFFELIPGAFLKYRRDGYEISIMNPIDNNIYEIPPTLMVDGVMVGDPAIIANINPEIVEQIDIMKERYFVGDYIFYGIVNVITKEGDFRNVNLPSYATRIRYRVIDPVSTFVSPDYSSEEKKSRRIPDFRNTLYWNPSVLPDKEGKARVEFWSSDIISDYMINIQGVTAEGNPVSLKKIITVE